MSEYKLTFERVVSNTDLAQFHNNIVLNFKTFSCQPLQFPERPGEHHYIYSVAKRYHDPEVVSELEIISTVIADQTRIGEVHLSIHIRHDKFIQPFSEWLQAEYGVSLMPPPATIPTRKAGAPQLEANQWLIEQHLDKHIPLSQLRRRWVDKLLDLDDRRAPADPADSMKKVIAAERKRRQKQGKKLP